MSTFNRNTLALALAAALLPASAFAFDVTTMGDNNPETIAAQLGTTVTTSEPFLIVIQPGTDNIVGRTVGFNIKLTLLDGAKFNTQVAAPTVGSALVGWNPVTVSGGAVASSTVQFLLSPPPGGGQFVNSGDLLAALTFNLQNVSTTGLTRVLVELVDSGTGGVILNGSGTFSFTSNLIVRNNGIAFSCNTSAGDLGKRIDVASDNTQASKTLFTPGPFPVAANDAFGAIGSSLGMAGQTFFNAGAINAAVSGGFVFAAGDTLDVTLSGVSFLPEFDAPGAIFLSTTNNCATPGAVPGVINMAGTQATFSFDPSVAATALPMFVCLDATGTDVIDQSALAVTATFTRGTDPALTLGAGCDLLPLQFNGSVVKVFTFNPAGNTTQESFLRVSNWGNTGGKVTVEGWDDTGAAAASPVTFNLAAGESVQVKSDNLENGSTTFTGKVLTGALGDGTGKWRLVVTGEFDGMNVTSLNRNNTTFTLTNLTDSDNGGEQKSDSK